MLTIPNILSLMRLPLALLFLQESPIFRSLAILLAMLSDGLDGYIARRFRLSSPLGTFLDPLMDKFFVLFILGIFIVEDRLNPWEAMGFLCRDFALIIFGVYLFLRGKLLNYRFHAIWCGKLTTTLQFFILLGLTYKLSVPSYVYTVFITLGFLALIELALSKIPENNMENPSP